MTAPTLKQPAALFRTAMGGLIVLFLALVATKLPGQESGSQADQSRTEAQPYRDNERIVTDADRSKIVLVRWAIGSRDNIVTLRIPLPYVPLVGAAPFGPDYPDPNYRQPFMSTLISINACASESGYRLHTYTQA